MDEMVVFSHRGWDFFNLHDLVDSITVEGKHET
jgi:hypothetical protein